MAEPRQATTEPQGHALGGQGHLRAHGRPGVRRALLLRRAHGRRGRRARGAPERPRARDARDLRARRRARPRSRGDVERAPRHRRRSSGWRTPPSTCRASCRHRLGIPAALVADLAAAEEVSHRVRVREDSALAHRSLADVELPVEVGMRVVAIRRGKEWIIDPDGDDTLLPDDVLILRGPPDGHRRAARARRRARVAPPADLDDDPTITDGSRPCGRRARRDEEHLGGRGRPRLLGVALQRPEPRGRGEPPRGPARRDARAARGVGAPRRPPRSSIRRRCAACCTSAVRRRRSATPRSRWCGSSRSRRRCTRSCASRSATADEVIARVPVAAGSALDGMTLAEAQLELETGFYLLAIRRAGRYFYRPRGNVRLERRRRADRQRPRRGAGEAGRALRVPDARGRRHRRDRARPSRPTALTPRPGRA